MMAIATPTSTNGRQPPSDVPLRGRGRPVMVTMRTSTALASLIEGIALADEVIVGADRIALAASVGSRQIIVFEAGRLSVRAQAARTELRAMAALIEKRP